MAAVSVESAATWSRAETLRTQAPFNGIWQPTEGLSRDPGRTKFIEQLEERL